MELHHYIILIIILIMVITLSKTKKPYTSTEWNTVLEKGFKKHGPVPDSEYKMSDTEFCKNESAFSGEHIDSVKQIKSYTFSGEELKEYVEFHIQNSLINKHF